MSVSEAQTHVFMIRVSFHYFSDDKIKNVRVSMFNVFTFYLKMEKNHTKNCLFISQKKKILSAICIRKASVFLGNQIYEGCKKNDSFDMYEIYNVH